MAPAEPRVVQVEVVFAPAPRTVHRLVLRLPLGSTVGEAVQASALLGAHALQEPGGLVTAVWGRVVGPATVLRDLDRVELLRPLRVDPKEARRLRYRSQGGRGARGRR